MTIHLKKWLVAMGLSLLTGCAAQAPNNEPTAFQLADPHSILVLPVVNESVDVDAPTTFCRRFQSRWQKKGIAYFRFIR